MSETTVISLAVTAQDGWQRLDSFLGKSLEGRISREKVKKAVQEGRVRLNGETCLVPKTKVGPGDGLEIELAASSQGPQPEEGELDILYRDADLAVINKPSGLTVHPCPSCPSGTLVNRLLASFPELSAMRAGTDVEDEAGSGNDGESDFELYEDAEAGFSEDPCEYADSATGGEWDESVFFAQDGDRPGIVHRLDKDTTGLLLVTLNEPARLRLAADFASRRVKKEYLALVYGVPGEASGRINAPIGRDPENKTRMKAFAARDGRHLTERAGGRDALSDYRVLYADPAGRFSLLAVRIHTGRTHQIRVHLRFIGHPIIGDSTYFDFNAAKPLFNESAQGKVNSRAELAAFFSRVASRPLLHAWKVCFEHPQCLEDFSDDASSETEAALERGAAEARQGGLFDSGGAASGFSTRRADSYALNQSVYRSRPGVNVDEELEADDESGLEVAFCCPPPEDFFQAVRELSRRMQPVVLTGNSGCGKSSVLERLAAKGVPVWSADGAVAESYAVGGDGWHMLRSAFGSRFVPDDDSPVDKRALFAAMISDDTLRRDVERIVHPIADRSMRDFFLRHDFWSRPEGWEPAGSGGALPELQPALAVAEVPLYFESAHLDKSRSGPKPLVVGIHCPARIRAARLRADRSWPESMIEKMESWQWPEEKKMQACDLVLDNSGGLAELDAKVAALLAELARLRAKRLDEIVRAVRELCGCA